MRIAFWSIGLGDHAYMLQACVQSYRAVGMPYDFYAIANLPIRGAATIHHPPEFEHDQYFFKFRFLRDYIAPLDYDCFVFVDADCLFARRTEGLEELLEAAPVAAALLEGDCSRPEIADNRWFDFPLGRYVALARQLGVRHPTVHNVNGGFFACRRSGIRTLFDDCTRFREEARRIGWSDITEEPPLVYSVMLRTPDLTPLLSANHPRFWSVVLERPPDGHIPLDEDYVWNQFITGDRLVTRAAIVHLIRYKEELVAMGKRDSG